jgi:hypothetical protein
VAGRDSDRTALARSSPQRPQLCREPLKRLGPRCAEPDDRQFVVGAAIRCRACRPSGFRIRSLRLGCPR